MYVYLYLNNKYTQYTYYVNKNFYFEFDSKCDLWPKLRHKYIMNIWCPKPIH